ncbi:S-adenosyl-L-methionine-dependent methyltransferase [Cutaneotrichosporon oleaginosum]|uniref:S-adenosyl-L-methionine-dependent methyltransferase n=1 Tax=Cutaneotrichosporon oleaginosum TaxID=879819 RepID=A0A0J0XQN2_9TREE|nr:S-adenosyl-L-methionine-dependent methyltransferase [Cutaneotrichosporon oleaginosum]KLT43388.1 S-adenosyl-L-methionine-dependent methyltransferase [Cutaneotrichosporon oleaginosum]TXT05398.1 hypothetical protein COLE_06718 [Cutaneotrichosporon oleaginosum]
MASQPLAQPSANDAHHPNPVRAPPATHTLLERLHTLSSEQESRLDLLSIPPDAFHTAVADQFVALEQDKCQFVYALLRASGARTIVEAGTSYGVSTIYLALAARQNAAALGGVARVIGTEHEAAKAAQAREYWREAGVGDVIELRVGDLRETLKNEMGSVDCLLLDIWAPMALPALKLVRPHLRPGATVICDNTIASAERYADLLAYVNSDPAFQHITVPYHKGLGLMVYYPETK